MAVMHQAARQPGVPSPVRARILLVDDDRELCSIYERILTRAGYAVEVSHDGQTAAELVASKAFDVIVSDIKMPAMDGLTFLRKVRASDLDVPVIMITAAADSKNTAEASHHGVFGFLAKPIGIADMLSIVGRALRLQHAG